MRARNLGWGRTTVDKFTTLDGSVKIDASFSSFVKDCGEETKGGCVFLQGLISGIASEVMEEELGLGVPRCERDEEGLCQLHLVSNR